ncbi:MAG: hypothetical protein WAL48_07295 [Xanthobacteraceae bacterium]
MGILRAMPAAADSAPPAPSLGRAACYDELLALCKRQIEALHFNYEMLDTVAGFNVGYSNKLFGPGVKPVTRRHFSHQSFDAYLAALGLELVVVENPDKVARAKAFAARMLLKCSQHDRENAFKRWRRQEITTGPPADPGPSEQPPA